ncbi:MAG TPA: TIGR01777 family oxidoreductase [Sedimentisphaerales bacterium]|nr:TIGR01777 family oxidoreductase [Sedimentisphaerales bacterium]
MAKRIVISGATGFIGRTLCRELCDEYEIVALSRDAKRAASLLGDHAQVCEWGGRTASFWSAQVDGAYAVVNLAGENVGQGRWTQAKLDSIAQSRSNGAVAVVDAVAAVKNKPAVVIQGSAVGYYGSRGDEILTESSAPGVSFLADVCRRCESIATRVEKQGVRSVAIRTGIVLGRDGGALPRLMMPFRFFLGGYVGNGKQWFPWIGLEDEVRAIRFLLENPNLQGAFNLTSPHPATLKQVVHALGQALRRPAWLRTPGLAARLAMGRMVDETLLASQRAIPQGLMDAGFQFKHSQLEAAFAAILQGENHESE